MLTLFANRHNPTNTDILDASGNAVYRITTDHRETTVTKGDGTVIGTLNFPIFGTHTLGLAGQAELPESTFLRRAGTWGRAFRAPDGREYKWHNHDGRLQLTFIKKAESGSLLIFYPGSYALNASGTNKSGGRFAINDALLPILDLVILTWVTIERRRQSDEPARSGENDAFKAMLSTHAAAAPPSASG